MKKIIFLTLIAFLALGTISAQNWGNRWGTVQSITVEGTLQLQNGEIAVSTGNSVYIVPVLKQYIGFIDGLKEGERVSILGYAVGNVLQPEQVTINGKSYDFQTAGNANYGSGWCGGYGGCYSSGTCYGGGFASGRGGGRR